MVYLEHSEELLFDEERMPDAQILRGNVVFRHDSAWMYCDSAYFYEQTNSLTALGHVRFVQGDTLSGYGDVLYYDGNTRLARLRRHVRLLHRSTELTTDSCNYDRVRNLAYYFSGGQIVDSLNTLTSRWGQYYPPASQATFRHQVHLTNPKFTLDADTLLYNTETNLAKLISPTTIRYEEETTIWSSNGWYNTHTEKSSLYDRSLIYHLDGRTLTADTIYYDKALGYGRMLHNMVLVDSANHMTLTGEYGEAWEVERVGFATDSALLVEWSDSLMYTYAHADTLFYEQVRDTSVVDSAYHRIRAHHGVRIYREDVQAVCDSMMYQGRDSIMSLYTEPVCWSDSNQVSADTVHIYIVNGTVDHMVGIGSAMASQMCRYDTLCFNQMSGKRLVAYIRDGDMRQVDVMGNAETIFYPEDEAKHEYIGMNFLQSSEVTIYMKEQMVERVRFLKQPIGTIYPLDQIPPGKDKLIPFFWATLERPISPASVYWDVRRTVRPKAGVVSAAEETTPEDTKQDDKLRQKRAEQKNRNRRSTLKTE